jgi:hypothetical protein
MNYFKMKRKKKKAVNSRQNPVTGGVKRDEILYLNKWQLR